MYNKKNLKKDTVLSAFYGTL